MKLQYLGTAAAEGIPALFCHCERCHEARRRGGRNIRTRSQALVDGKLLIDFPADTYMHCLVNNIDVTDIKHVLITHSHSDHLYPNDLYLRTPGFSSLGTTEEEKHHFYGSSSAVRKINGYMALQSLDFESYLGLHALEPYTEYKIDDYTVIALEAIHDPTSGPVIYIIKDAEGKALLYANDTNYFSEKVWEYLEKSGVRFDFVSLDCTDANIPDRRYIGHMNFTENCQARDRLVKIGCADEKTVFCSNHFSHNGYDVLYEEFCELAGKNGFIVSYDGMTVEF